MVIMFMGVVKVVFKVLFEFEGKFIGNVICVFILNVLMVILNLNFEKGIIVEELNVFLCEIVFYLDFCD